MASKLDGTLSSSWGCGFCSIMDLQVDQHDEPGTAKVSPYLNTAEVAKAMKMLAVEEEKPGEAKRRCHATAHSCRRSGAQEKILVGWPPWAVMYTACWADVRSLLRYVDEVLARHVSKAAMPSLATFRAAPTTATGLHPPSVPLAMRDLEDEMEFGVGVALKCKCVHRTKWTGEKPVARCNGKAVTPVKLSPTSGMMLCPECERSLRGNMLSQ